MLQRVHKPSLGPYTFSNLKVCLNCGKPLGDDIPVDEACPTHEQQLEAALLDFYLAAERVMIELNIMQPFLALAQKHAAVLRTLPEK